MAKTEGISRRAVLASGAAALPLVAIRTRPAGAAEFTYKLATGQSLTQPINTRLEQAVGRIKEATAAGSRSVSFQRASSVPTPIC